MRSYQRFFLCASLLTQTAYSWAYAQDEVPAPSSAASPAETPPASPKSKAKPAPLAPLQITDEALPTSPSAPNPGVPPAAPASGVESNIPKGKNARTKIKLKQTGEAVLRQRKASNFDVAITGEAQTLPKNVARVRYILRSAHGDKGFDNAGKTQNIGASVTAVGHAFVAEYGLTDRFVLQMITPYTSNNHLSINANTFKQSKQYATQYQKIVDIVTPTLISRGICASPAACRTAIDKGLALGVATPVELPTGEVATVGANVPIREAANSLILNGVEPSDGRTGLGDIQFGLGYNFLNTPMQILTLGLGLRVPTGAFTSVSDAYRAPGAGFLASGLIMKYDLKLNPVILSVSEQIEYALSKAKRTRTSLLDPKFLNAADPHSNAPDIAGAGDGVSNDGKIERKGVYHEGYMRAAYALGTVSKHLKAGAVYAYYGWIIDPEHQNQGQLYQAKHELYTASYAFSIDGLALDPIIPATFSYRHEMPIAGKGLVVATTSDFYQVNLYYKF
ncbi:MAG: hypothetical protein H7249_17470 [Chitinophagaceae bacterium]|nr:hypothetical protein [Oligoflexus sp.]